MSIFQNVGHYSTIVSLAALIASIFSPIATNFINNRHQYKMHKLDIEESRISSAAVARRAVLESFVANIGKCIADPTTDNHAEFGTSYFVAYQYIPKKYWGRLDQLYKKMREDRIDEALDSYYDIIAVVAETLKSSSL